MQLVVFSRTQWKHKWTKHHLNYILWAMCIHWGGMVSPGAFVILWRGFIGITRPTFISAQVWIWIHCETFWSRDIDLSVWIYKGRKVTTSIQDSSGFIRMIKKALHYQTLVTLNYRHTHLQTIKKHTNQQWERIFKLYSSLF